MADRRLDPVTGDFVAASRGGFELCDDIENQIAFSFMIARGSWEGDPDLGHRFAEIARSLDEVESRNRLRDLARDAVKWLIESGKLESVEIIAESFRPGGVAFQLDYRTPGSKVLKSAGGFLVPTGAG